MLLDEQSMDLERFSITKTSQNSSRVKSTGTGIIYNISDKKKNTKVFHSKFRLLGEHDLCRPLTTFFRLVNSPACVDLYRVSYSEWGSADLEECSGFATQIMLAQQTKFRVENFCIFFLSEML